MSFGDVVNIDVATRIVSYIVISKLMAPLHHSQLAAMIGDDRRREWRLLYRTALNGLSAADLHKLCDGQGPTVTAARIRDT